MITQELLSLHDHRQRMELREHGFRREATAEVVRFVHLNQSQGMIIHSALTPEDVDRVIASEIAYVREPRPGLRVEDLRP